MLQLVQTNMPGGARLDGELSPTERLSPFVWQAILPAGGLSGRRLRYATNLPGFAVSVPEDTKPENSQQVELLDWTS
jgi:hypothetical protein